MRGKAELYDLVGDPSRARERLGWSPTVDFDELVQLLVDADLERLRAELEPTSVGARRPWPWRSREAPAACSHPSPVLSGAPRSACAHEAGARTRGSSCRSTRRAGSSSTRRGTSSARRGAWASGSARASGRARCGISPSSTRASSRSSWTTSRSAGTDSASRTSTAGPGTPGMPEFDACFATMRRRHDDIDRVQVTNAALEELVLETGLGREKVHRIPIGIDVEAFRAADTCSPRGRAARSRAAGVGVRRRLVPEGRRGVGRRARAEADQGPGRAARGRGAASRASPRARRPAHGPRARLRASRPRAARRPVPTRAPARSRRGRAGVRRDRRLPRHVARRRRAAGGARVDGDRECRSSRLGSARRPTSSATARTAGSWTSRTWTASCTGRHTSRRPPQDELSAVRAAARATAEENSYPALRPRWKELLRGFVELSGAGRDVVGLSAARAGRYGRGAARWGRLLLPDARRREPGVRVFYGHDRVPAPGAAVSGGSAKIQRLAARFPNRPDDFTVAYLGSNWLPRDLGPLLWLLRRRRIPLVVNQDGVGLPGLGGRGDRRRESAAPRAARGRRPRPLPERVLQALRRRVGRFPRGHLGDPSERGRRLALHAGRGCSGRRPRPAPRRRSDAGLPARAGRGDAGCARGVASGRPAARHGAARRPRGAAREALRGRGPRARARRATRRPTRPRSSAVPTSSCTRR